MFSQGSLDSLRDPDPTPQARPAFGLGTPRLSIPSPTLPGGGPSGGAIGPTVIKATEIKFTAPDGSSVTGRFGEGDDNKLLKILRDSGGVAV